MALVKGKTASGFDFAIDPESLNDFYVLELFGRAQHNDVLAFAELIEKLLGAEQKAALLKHCEDEHGRAPVTKVGHEIEDIYRVAKENLTAKNS